MSVRVFCYYVFMFGLHVSYFSLFRLAEIIASIKVLNAQLKFHLVWSRDPQLKNPKSKSAFSSFLCRIDFNHIYFHIRVELNPLFFVGRITVAIWSVKIMLIAFLYSLPATNSNYTIGFFNGWVLCLTLIDLYYNL